MYRIIWFCAFGVMLASHTACRRANDGEKIAEVDGTVVTRKELDRSGGKTLHNARQQLYQLERQKLDDYIGATLLTREAKDRNVSVSTLLDQEVNAKTPAVSEEEIRDFCRGQIATFKIPRYIRFSTEFPTTVTGKVQKYRMREISVAELGLTTARAVRTA